MKFLTRIHRASRANLKKDDKAWNYLRSRGVSPEQIKTHELGWFPPEQWPPWVERGESKEADSYLDWSGNGVKLRGKLLLPLHDPRGRLAGFQLRTPSSDEKDYSVYRTTASKRTAVFFGIKAAMPFIWETSEIFLVEGVFDLFPMARLRSNSVAIVTSRLMGRQREFVRRFVDQVRFVFDMDEQGRKGYEKFDENFGSEFDEVTRVRLDGSDVADTWRRSGDEGIRRSVELAIDPLSFRSR